MVSKGRLPCERASKTVSNASVKCYIGSILFRVSVEKTNCDFFKSKNTVRIDYPLLKTLPNLERFLIEKTYFNAKVIRLTEGSKK